MSEDRCRYTHDVEGVSQEEWRCPHEVHADHDLCLFHLPPDRTPGADAVSRAFREAIEAGRPEFLGARFGDLRLNGARLDAGEAGPIRLEFATVRGDIDINDATVGSPLVISSVTVAGALRCRRSTFQGIRLSHVAFAGPVETTDARFRGAVTVGRDVSFERGLDAGGATFESKVEIRGSVFGDDVSFAGAAFGGSVSFERVLVQGGVDFEAATAGGLSCSGLEAETLALDGLSADGSAAVSVESSEIGRLTLRETTLSGTVVLAGNEFDQPVEAARVDLSGADVRNADLTRADLGRATLRGTTFRSTEFSGATLAGADLEDADLAGARLHGTDLRGARLTNASLRGASLDGAVLDGAALDGADLQRVAFGTASFYRASFEGCRIDRATTFARYNHYDPAAVQADGFALPARRDRTVLEGTSAAEADEYGDGEHDALERLDRAVHVHRRTHALLDRAGSPDPDDHDRRALRLRAAWYRRHALGSSSRRPRAGAAGADGADADGLEDTGADADDPADGAPSAPAPASTSSPTRVGALLGALVYGLGFLLVDLGERLRALIGVALVALAGFAVAYPAVGTLSLDGTPVTSPSVSLVRAAVWFSAERFVEGVAGPVRRGLAAAGATPLPPVETGVEATGQAAALAPVQTGLGTALAVLLVLGLVGRGVRRLWARTG